ncbi:MAG: NAD(P)-dependent oxidoreductase [Elusimicrobiaceae bacterium]|nr:NAD(P)-dependent oxidoreductase [Elusimicrobiaceae bacterium]
MPCSKILFATGLTGLIGKELWQPLTQAGFEVYALALEDNLPSLPHIHWLKGNLFDPQCLSNLMAQVKPQYLLNMAWATTGDYQTSNINFDFLCAGLHLLKAFAANGGQRIVFAGTCLEYAPQNHPLKETDPILPTVPYALCKQLLFKATQGFCLQNQLSFACGRIFYVYGRGEAPSRLTASIINKLQQGIPVFIQHAQLTKDYMYTKDIAAAFTALLASNVQGAVNICTGKGISLAQYATIIAQKLGKPQLLHLQQLPTSQPLQIVGDNTRLIQEVGFTPVYTLAQALPEIVTL